MRNVSGANESRLNVYLSSTEEEESLGQSIYHLTEMQYSTIYVLIVFRIRRKAQRSNAQTGSGSIAESPNQPPNANLRDETERRISPNSTPSGILDTSPPQTAHSWSNEGLQQVGILSREAQFGKFSLENILSVPDVLRPHPPPRSPTLTADSFNDPITCNMLSFPVALGLFDR